MGSSWSDANRRYLAGALADLMARLRAGRDGEAPEAGAARDDLAGLAAAMAQPPALLTLVERFGLTPFERDVALLCAGVELDGTIAAECARMHGDPRRTQPTFSLLLERLPGAHWDAIAPTAPLRRVPLVELGAGEAVTTAPLRIEERVVYFLVGIDTHDARLASVIVPVREDAPGELAPSHAAAAQAVRAIWTRGGDAGLTTHICGGDRPTRRAVFAGACASARITPYALRAADVPASAAERDVLCRLWEREMCLAPMALLVEVDDADPPDALRAAIAVVERSGGSIALSSRAPVANPFPRVEVPPISFAERSDLWRAGLAAHDTRVAGGTIDALAAQFDLAPASIRAAIVAARLGDARELPERLWDACRTQARPRLDDLAHRVDASATWDDLVLPDLQRDLLRQITTQVRHRATVHERWGFAARSARGLGVSALFAGAPGTGKTMAAEVLARDLGLDLYRIDLSQVVDKYIGETEKNLRRVFDAAEQGGCILLFDEADALFGKRSEVKDSHDRHANIEVGYLLQRMEAYRGLAILTTNMREALDVAFLRRLRFVVDFPFPDQDQRAAIWARAFPADVPKDPLDIPQLSRWQISGGTIHNIALAAAFLAAAAGTPVRLAHILHAARAEYAKLGRPDAELRTVART